MMKIQQYQFFSSAIATHADAGLAPGAVTIPVLTRRSGDAKGY
jgi:hypothetical protein